MEEHGRTWNILWQVLFRWCIHLHRIIVHLFCDTVTLLYSDISAIIVISVIGF